MFARVARSCCRGKAGLANLLVTAELVPMAWRAQVWRNAGLSWFGSRDPLWCGDASEVCDGYDCTTPVPSCTLYA